MALAALEEGRRRCRREVLPRGHPHQPDLAEAQNNLGNLLAAARRTPRPAYHFEQAIRANPTYVEARHSYGLVLALTRHYPKAVAELRAAVRLAPQPARRASISRTCWPRWDGLTKRAREYERGASETSDPGIRQAALDALRTLPR